MAEANPDAVAQLRELLGERGVRTEPDDFLPDIIVKPSSTEQVAGVLKICSAGGQALVPIGGKSGLANGHHQTDGEIGLSLERMNAIEEIDTANRTMTVLTRSQSERNALWEIRDDVLDFFSLSPFIPFDISITVDRMEDFIADTVQAGAIAPQPNTGGAAADDGAQENAGPTEYSQSQQDFRRQRDRSGLISPVRIGEPP